MGVKLTDILPVRPVTLEEISGKIIAIDTSLFLYQFLSSIRQLDGAPLTDSKDRITSHLVGLFNRSTALAQKGIKLIFVLDGKAPALKKAERERRASIKEEASRKYKEAVEEEDVEAMKKYAQRTSTLSREMIAEAVELINALGFPVVQAPSEGEAQAAHLVKKGDAWAVASQDADSFLFGAPRVIRNLAISGKRKRPNAIAFETVQPEIVELHELLQEYGLTQEQLIALAMLVGTDFNIGGIPGIGPKKALKLVKEKGNNLDILFNEAAWKDHFETSWKEVFDTIAKMPVTDGYILKWKTPDAGEVVRILVDEHQFSEERVKRVLASLGSVAKAKEQRGLGDFV